MSFVGAGQSRKWKFTEDGALKVVAARVLHSPTPVGTPRPGVPKSQWTSLEYLTDLSNNGWTLQQKAPAELKTLSHALGDAGSENKLLYVSSNLIYAYLKAFAYSVELRSLGVTSIKHGQTSEYYKSFFQNGQPVNPEKMDEKRERGGRQQPGLDIEIEGDDNMPPASRSGPRHGRGSGDKVPLLHPHVSGRPHPPGGDEPPHIDDDPVVLSDDDIAIPPNGDPGSDAESIMYTPPSPKAMPGPSVPVSPTHLPSPGPSLPPLSPPTLTKGSPPFEDEQEDGGAAIRNPHDKKFSLHEKSEGDTTIEYLSPVNGVSFNLTFHIGTLGWQAKCLWHDAKKSCRGNETFCTKSITLPDMPDAQEKVLTILKNWCAPAS